MKCRGRHQGHTLERKGAIGDNATSITTPPSKGARGCQYTSLRVPPRAPAQAWGEQCCSRTYAKHMPVTRHPYPHMKARHSIAIATMDWTRRRALRTYRACDIISAYVTAYEDVGRVYSVHGYPIGYEKKAREAQRRSDRLRKYKHREYWEDQGHRS